MGGTGGTRTTMGQLLLHANCSRTLASCPIDPRRCQCKKADGSVQFIICCMRIERRTVEESSFSGIKSKPKMPKRSHLTGERKRTRSERVVSCDIWQFLFCTCQKEYEATGCFTIRSGLVLPGMAWPGLGRHGLARLVLAWPGLAWPVRETNIYNVRSKHPKTFFSETNHSNP